MNFDPYDVYDAASLYEMLFCCRHCGQTYDFETDCPLGLEYYHRLGQRAKKDGWLVKDTSLDDLVAYDIVCPDCVARKKLSLPESERNPPNKAIETLLTMMEEYQTKLKQFQNRQRRAEDEVF